MVRQELERIAAQRPATRVLLDEDFTVATLRRLLQAEPFDQLHIASHAELQTKEGSPARIYTANDDLTLSDLALTARTSSPQGLDLVVVSACRTALGDELSELGIAGLALQAGASSALGSLWTIDDAAATAFAVQFHRLLDLGYSKEKALQTTQAFFRRGDIHVKGNDIVNPNGEILVAGLSPADQARLGAGLQHPYFWAGMLLSGRPW
jgi:CHAT domain-containing protein